MSRSPRKNIGGSERKNVLSFRDLEISLSEWCPFGQNAISTFNSSIDSFKGVKSSLLTGVVDEEPKSSEFRIKPMFTRVMLKDFDRYNWIKFTAGIEFEEEVKQIEEIGTHVDKSGFINYSVEIKKISNKNRNFSLDEVTVINADLIEDTSIMMEALLTQFQRRILKVVFGDSPFREKFFVAYTSGLLPGMNNAEDYADGEDMQNEINQLLGISYDFFDLPGGGIVMLGTNGLIFISEDPGDLRYILSFYSFIRSLQTFQSAFFNRIRRMWDVIKDLRTDILHIEKEEDIGRLQTDLSQLGADVVLIEEVLGFMRSGIDDMERIWEMKGQAMDGDEKFLSGKLDIKREITVVNDKVNDMEMVSRGLVDEIQGLRDMLNTLAEKRMREVSNLMATNVQQGSDAQLAMAANVKASRYSGAALKILSTISAGALGMKISDLVMKGLDGLNNDLKWDLKWPGTDTAVDFYGGWLQVLVGMSLWALMTFIFFHLIKASSNKMKEEKLAKDFVLHLRLPIDVRADPKNLRKYIDSKEIIFHNVEVTGHRTSWYQRQKKGEDEIFYTMTMAYDPRTGHILHLHANTEDKKGDVNFTTDFIMKELKKAGLITRKEADHILDRIGLPGGK